MQGKFCFLCVDKIGLNFEPWKGISSEALLVNFPALEKDGTGKAHFEAN